VTSQVRVVVVGGSFGGLTVAFELRRHLAPERAEIAVVAKDRRFTFIPSLTWVATGQRSLDAVSFELAEPLGRSHVAFFNETALSVDLDRKMVVTDRGEHRYDMLVVATGHRSANEAVPGLGPFDGPGHSPMSPPEAQELAGALRRLLAEPGPVVVGAAPGASCIGPAYELAFELDHLLRRRRLRHHVPISFVTPEPFLGHMGMGGAGRIRQLLEASFEERDIGYTTSVAVTRITEDAVELDGGRRMDFVLSIIIPPLAGVKAVASSPGLANPNGFVPVDGHYRHPDADGVYAVGVAVALPPVGETAVPVNFPKTGHMTEQMATIAAADIAARLQGREAPRRELAARCVLDMGDRGVYMAVEPVRPPRDRIPTVSEGRRWLLAKRAFERAYLWHARRGRRLPTALGW
jgi:sulfide:quinone oxidoreductase